MGGRISGEALWRRVRRLVPVTSPAAGADWLTTVPAGHVYDLVSVQEQLVTSAVAGTRNARLQVNDGVATFLDLAAFIRKFANVFHPAVVILNSLDALSDLIVGTDKGVH